MLLGGALTQQRSISDIEKKLVDDIDDAEVNSIFEPYLNNFPNESQYDEAGKSVVIPGPCTLHSRADGTFLVKPVHAEDADDADNYAANDDVKQSFYPSRPPGVRPPTAKSS